MQKGGKSRKVFQSVKLIDNAMFCGVDIKDTRNLNNGNSGGVWRKVS